MDEPAGSEEALVSYFLALPAEARREYAALAERDRRFGEDVAAEERAAGERAEKGRGA